MATVKAVCFDIGETLVDETRHWSVIAGEAGVPELTLFGVLGGVAARGEHHTRVFDILGIEPIAGPDYAAQDLYPDALPYLAELKARGYRLGLAGNQPARTEHFLRTLGVDVDLVASSAPGVSRNPRRDSSSVWPPNSHSNQARSPTSATVSTTTSSQ